MSYSKEELVRSIKNNRIYDYIADHYYEMPREDLKEVLLAVLGVGYDNANSVYHGNTTDQNEYGYMMELGSELIDNRCFIYEEDLPRDLLHWNIMGMKDLTDEQLLKIRKEITLNSLFLKDYQNSFDIEPKAVKEFFDEYWYELYQTQQEDSEEALLKYYHSIEWPEAEEE